MHLNVWSLSTDGYDLGETGLNMFLKLSESIIDTFSSGNLKSISLSSEYLYRESGDKRRLDGISMSSGIWEENNGPGPND